MRQHTDQHMTLWKAQRASLLCLCLGLMVLAPSLAQAASLENPSGGLFYSGIGVISGWKCEANGELTVRFNGGEPIPLVYGSRTWSGWSKKIHKRAEYHPASLDPSFLSGWLGSSA